MTIIQILGIIAGLAGIYLYFYFSDKNGLNWLYCIMLVVACFIMQISYEGLFAWSSIRTEISHAFAACAVNVGIFCVVYVVYLIVKQCKKEKTPKG